MADPVTTPAPPPEESGLARLLRLLFSTPAPVVMAAGAPGDPGVPVGPGAVKKTTPQPLPALPGPGAVKKPAPLAPIPGYEREFNVINRGQMPSIPPEK